MLRMSDADVAAMLDHPGTPAEDRAARQKMAAAG
jgi:hypothetical protein